MASGAPKLLRATYLAETEGLLRETRATGWFYFPGPVFWLIIVLLGDWAVLGIDRSWAGLGAITNALGQLPSISGRGPGGYLLIVFGLLTAGILLWLLIRWIRWVATVYAVTTHRVIIQRGIFSRDFDEIPIPQVRGVDVHQSLLQRMFHYGTVRVSSEGTGHLGNEDWEGIPKPFEFQRLIESANQAITSSVGTGARR